MKKVWGILSVILPLAACQGKKELPNKQELFRKEMNAIDWTKVDEYPSYSQCDSCTDKEEAYTCFYTQLAEELQEKINAHPLFSSDKPYDSILLNVKIVPNENPKIHLAKSSDLLLSPRVADSILGEIAKSMRPILPASKRGIPVQSELVVKIKRNQK